MAAFRRSLTVSLRFVVVGGPAFALDYTPFRLTRFHIPAGELAGRLLLAALLIAIDSERQKDGLAAAANPRSAAPSGLRRGYAQPALGNLSPGFSVQSRDIRLVRRFPARVYPEGWEQKPHLRF